MVEQKKFSAKLSGEIAPVDPSAEMAKVLPDKVLDSLSTNFQWQKAFTKGD